jgi:N-acetylglutamate synthase/N-acetylornithine aminotransferase
LHLYTDASGIATLNRRFERTDTHLPPTAHMHDAAGDHVVRGTSLVERDEVRIRAELGIGRGKATVWTCDLTKEYVAINGDYRS